MLDRMKDQGFITTAQASEFKQQAVPTERAVMSKGVAPYFVEHVRRELDDRFGSQLYSAGVADLHDAQRRHAEVGQPRDGSGMDSNRRAPRLPSRPILGLFGLDEPRSVRVAPTSKALS